MCLFDPLFSGHLCFRIDIDRAEREFLGVAAAAEQKAASSEEDASVVVARTPRLASEENPQEASKASQQLEPRDAVAQTGHVTL